MTEHTDPRPGWSPHQPSPSPEGLPLIDPLDTRSAATQIADILRDAIAAGDYAPGELIPSQPDLALHFKVARETVKSALRTLRSEDLIYGRRGAGTFVRDGADEVARATVDLPGALREIYGELDRVHAAVAELLRRVPDGDRPVALDEPGTLLADMRMRPSEIMRLLQAAESLQMTPGEYVVHAIAYRCHDILGPPTEPGDDEH